MGGAGFVGGQGKEWMGCFLGGLRADLVVLSYFSFKLSGVSLTASELIWWPYPTFPLSFQAIVKSSFTHGICTLVLLVL